MAEHVIKLPDIGEGIAEAELVEWHVKEGDLVREDDDLAAVMTDKATVEIPSPVDGTVTWLGPALGDMVAVGSEIIKIETAGEIAEKAKETPAEKTEVEHDEEAVIEIVEEPEKQEVPPITQLRTGEQKALASPAVRKKARDNGIDLNKVRGSGPDGRVVHSDIEAWLRDGTVDTPVDHSEPQGSVTEIPVIGLRRKIANKMALAKARIPHITIVEEIDVTDLEGLRNKLNRSRTHQQPKLTLLPFIMQALTKAVTTYPNMNATYDDEAGVILMHDDIHAGIATQTPSGLIVPVIRQVQKRDIWNCASELVRLSEDTRKGTANREELSGSTITITSLGPLGGLVTTPIINHPEVAIFGINKMQIRPVWDGSKFIPRKMMNISASFDHRVIDGWDAANFVQELKKELETPHELISAHTREE